MNQRQKVRIDFFFLNKMNTLLKSIVGFHYRDLVTCEEDQDPEPQHAALFVSSSMFLHSSIAINFLDKIVSTEVFIYTNLTPLLFDNSNLITWLPSMVLAGGGDDGDIINAQRCERLRETRYSSKSLRRLIAYTANEVVVDFLRDHCKCLENLHLIFPRESDETSENQGRIDLNYYIGHLRGSLTNLHLTCSDRSIMFGNVFTNSLPTTGFRYLNYLRLDSVGNLNDDDFLLFSNALRSSLRRLYVHDPGPLLTGESFDEAFQSLEFLQFLRLSNSRQIKTLVGIRHLVNLEVLELSELPFAPIDLVAEGWGELAQLRTFEFSHRRVYLENKRTAADPTSACAQLSFLASLRHFEKLKLICPGLLSEVENNELEQALPGIQNSLKEILFYEQHDISIQNLNAIAKCNKLEKVEFDDECSFQKEDEENVLIPWEGPKNTLKHFSFLCYDDHFTHLRFLAPCTATLESLHLYDCGALTDISSLATLTNIRSLVLCKMSKITNKDIYDVFEEMLHPSRSARNTLTDLDLMGSKVTNKLLTLILQNVQKLWHLSIGTTIYFQSDDDDKMKFKDDDVEEDEEDLLLSWDSFVSNFTCYKNRAVAVTIRDLVITGSWKISPARQQEAGEENLFDHQIKELKNFFEKDARVTCRNVKFVDKKSGQVVGTNAKIDYDDDY
jgi:hypothetical protein